MVMKGAHDHWSSLPSGPQVSRLMFKEGAPHRSGGRRGAAALGRSVLGRGVESRTTAGERAHRAVGQGLLDSPRVELPDQCGVLLRMPTPTPAPKNPPLRTRRRP